MCIVTKAYNWLLSNAKVNLDQCSSPETVVDKTTFPHQDSHILISGVCDYFTQQKKPTVNVMKLRSSRREIMLDHLGGPTVITSILISWEVGIDIYTLLHLK